MPKIPRIKLTDEISIDVVDPDNVRPVYADLVTEFRIVNGVLHLSLATMSIEGDDAGTSRSARVCARLRIASNTIQFIQQVLSKPNKPSEAQIPPGQSIN
jgi:hypothetical protein